MTLEEKIALVKQDIQTRFPGKRYTIRILLWDDGTDLVECRHGSQNIIHYSTYYNNELSYHEENSGNIGSGVIVDETGKEYFAREKWEDDMVEVAYCKNRVEGKELCEDICDFCMENCRGFVNINDLQ